VFGQGVGVGFRGKGVRVAGRTWYGGEFDGGATASASVSLPSAAAALAPAALPRDALPLCLGVCAPR
jgi:hypothetical protein